MELSVRISLRSFFVINNLTFLYPAFICLKIYAFENKPNDRLALWISCSGSKIQLCIQPWFWEVCYHLFGVPLDTWQNGGPKRRGRKRSGSFPEKWKKVKGGHWWTTETCSRCTRCTRGTRGRIEAQVDRRETCTCKSRHVVSQRTHVLASQHWFS